jgi:gluconokinase
MVQPVARIGETPGDLWTYRVDAERAVVGAAISNGGKVVEWLSELTGGEIGDADWEAAAEQEIDQHGLTVLPFLAGERAPIWNDWATGAVVGLRLATSKADVIQAGMEAVTWRLALLYRALAGQAEAPHEIVANGGAILRSETWLQLLADAFEHPIIALPPDEEASARGAALLALQAVGLIGSLDEAADPAADGRVIAPNPERHAACRAAIDRQERLRAALYGAYWRPFFWGFGYWVLGFGYWGRGARVVR